MKGRRLFALSDSSTFGGESRHFWAGRSTYTSLGRGTDGYGTLLNILQNMVAIQNLVLIIF